MTVSKTGKGLSDDSEAIRGDEVAGSSAEWRESRIEELRRQIQDGTYHVDVHEVSRKIIDDHLRD